MVECKEHTWTKSNNVASAKFTTQREAVFFLRLAPQGYRRPLAMKHHAHPARSERLSSHLLGDVEIVEITEPDTTGHGTIRWLTASPPRSLAAPATDLQPPRSTAQPPTSHIDDLHFEVTTYRDGALEHDPPDAANPLQPGFGDVADLLGEYHQVQL